MRKTRFVVIGALLLLMTTGVALAATDYGIDRSVVSPGGGERASENYMIRDVIGEPAVGIAQSDSYQLRAGFLTYISPGVGATCGDVAPLPAGNGIVDMGDVVLLLNYVGHPGAYDLACVPCGDVAPCPDGNDVIDMGDVVLLLNYVGHPGAYDICCDASPASPTGSLPSSSASTDAGPRLEVDNVASLDPKDSSADYSHTTVVEIWVDATDFQSGQITLEYGETCADITDWQRNTTDFPLGTWDSVTPGQELITFLAGSPLSGSILIGTLTIEGLGDTDDCSTALDFLDTSKLFDEFGSELPATWTDGTFTTTATPTPSATPTTIPSSTPTPMPISTPTPTIIPTHIWTFSDPGYYPKQLPDAYYGSIEINSLADVPLEVQGVYWHDGNKLLFWGPGAPGCTLSTLGGGHTYDYMVAVSSACEWEIPLP